MGGVISGAKKALLPEEDEEEQERRPVMPGEVEKAVVLARSSLVRNQKKAAFNLHRLAKDSDHVRHQIAAEGGIIPLINMFKSKSHEVQENSIRALGELCRSEKCRSRVLDAGGWLPMLEGLKSKLYRIREASVIAMGNLAEYEEAQFKLVTEGATAGLIKFLQEDSRDDSLQSELKVLRTICNLCLHSKTHVRMVRDGALEPLYDVVQSPLKTLKHKIMAMEVLSHLCLSEANHRKIVELSGNTGLKRIVGMVGFYNDEVAMHAATAVENLAKNPVLIEKLVEEGALDPLKRIIKTNKAGPVVRALNALIALAQSPENQKSIARENFIPKILKLSQIGVDDVEQKATLLLALLAKNNVNRPKIIFHGGFKPLMYNAQYGRSVELRKSSQEVLGSLFQLPGAKRDALVRKAADKFKKSIIGFEGSNKGKGLSKTGNRQNANAAALIFGQGGNDDDSSDEDR